MDEDNQDLLDGRLKGGERMIQRWTQIYSSETIKDICHIEIVKNVS